MGCSSCGAQGALSPPPPVIGGNRAGWLAGNPAPFTSGVVHPRGGEPLMVGSHSVVPRCGAGGAPRWWGPTFLGAPHPASPRLTLRTTWSSRSFRPLLTVSLVLTVSLRRTTRLHGYLTNDGDSPGGDPPPQEGSRERPTNTARRVCSGLAFGFTNSSSHWGSPCGPPMWSTPVVGAPCRRASTARHQGPGRTQPKTHHRVSLTLQGVGDPATGSAPQLRHTPTGGATTPTPGVPERLRPTAEGPPTNTRRAPQHKGTPKGTPHQRDPTQAHHQTEPQRSRTSTTKAHHHGRREHHSRLPLEPSHSRVKSPTIKMRRRISGSPVRPTTVEHRVSTTMPRQHWG